MRERLHRFNAEGLEGPGDRSGPGRKLRLTEGDRSAIIALARATPPGKPVRWRDGSLEPADPEGEAHWTLDALARVARERGIRVGRGQVRRIPLREGVPWGGTRPWAASADPVFVPKRRRSSPATPTRLRARRPSAWTSSGR